MNWGSWDNFTEKLYGEIIFFVCDKKNGNIRIKCKCMKYIRRTRAIKGSPLKFPIAEDSRTLAYADLEILEIGQKLRSELTRWNKNKRIWRSRSLIFAGSRRRRRLWTKINRKVPGEGSKRKIMKKEGGEVGTKKRKGLSTIYLHIFELQLTFPWKRESVQVFLFLSPFSGVPLFSLSLSFTFPLSITLLSLYLVGKPN